MPSGHALTAAILVGCLIVGIGLWASYGMTDSLPRSDGSDFVGPPSLARLVETSSAIVVARHDEVTSSGTEVIVGGGPVSVGAPSLTAERVSTRVTVDQVIKDDGLVQVGAPITYDALGRLPATAEDVTVDAAADYPMLWPSGTEYVLFLNREPGDPAYYLPYWECGRILTAGAVSCSDGARSVPGFLAGMDRAALLAAVDAAVEAEGE